MPAPTDTGFDKLREKIFLNFRACFYLLASIFPKIVTFLRSKFWGKPDFHFCAKCTHCSQAKIELFLDLCHQHPLFPQKPFTSHQILHLEPFPGCEGSQIDPNTAFEALTEATNGPKLTFRDPFFGPKFGPTPEFGPIWAHLDLCWSPKLSDFHFCAKCTHCSQA